MIGILEEGIFEFIKKNGRVDSTDIVIHFKLRNDIILTALRNLREEGMIKRVGSGLLYEYEVKK